MSYYKTIEGKKYDAELLELAEKSVEGAGDGRISIADAKELFNAVIDGNQYTDIEKDTIEYIRANFKWTDEAIAWFKNEINTWQKAK